MSKRLNFKTLEWEDIKQTVARSPQILKQKANIGSHTVDEEFEVLHNKFLDISYNADALIKGIKKYNHSMTALVKSSTNIASAFEKVFHEFLEGSGKLNDRSAEGKEVVKRYEEAIISADRTKKYLDMHTEVEPAVTKQLEAMVTSIFPHLDHLVENFDATKKFFKKRNNALLDYDSCVDSIEKLEVQAGNLTAKRQQNLYSLKLKEYTLLENYEKLNNTAKKELPYLFGIVKKVIKPILFEVYYCQLSIYHILMLSTGETIKNIGPELGSSDVDYYCVSESSFSRQVEAAKVLDNLKLCCFRDNFLKTLTSGNSSASSLASKINHDLPIKFKNEPAVSGVENTIREKCIALYDYQGTQRGDLSFKKGDRILVFDKADGGRSKWWHGKIGSRMGIFPSNYVRKLDPSETTFL